MTQTQIVQKYAIRWYLKEWREHRGLTQEQLAEQIGCAKSTISKLETGAQPFKDKWIALCAAALGIEPSDLLRDPAQPKLGDLLKGWLKATNALQS